MSVKLKMVLIILFCVTVTACGGGGIKEAEPVEITEPPQQEKYYEYRARILDGLIRFSSLITVDDINPEPQLIIESRTVLGLSEQGGELTRFMMLDGEVVRYTFRAFGERGQSIEIYYFFDEGLQYIQRLRANYADTSFRAENRFDILQYQLASIIIDGDTAFIIDDALMQIEEFYIEVCFGIFSLETLNYFFENHEEERNA
jgi:hypothetical protein